MDDWDVLLMNDVLLRFMNYWYMFLVDGRFMDNGLDVLMDDILMMLMNPILMFFFYNILMVLNHYIFVLLSDLSCFDMLSEFSTFLVS